MALKTIFRANRPSAAALENAAANSRAWRRPWAQLIWLGFLLIPLPQGKPSLWGATAAAAGAFLLIFFWSFEKTGPWLWLARAAIFALGVVLFPFNAFAHTFFIYAGMPSVRGSSVESIVLAILTLIATFLYVEWMHLDGLYVGIVAIIVGGSVIAILWSRADAALRLNEVSQAALLSKDLEIARLAKIAERDRIARDLHDVLGHSLTLIAIKAELAQKLAPQDGERAAAEMQEVAAAARTALAEVRQTIAAMRSISLGEALAAVGSMLRAAGIEVTQQLAALPQLQSAQEHALAQAVLEAATNIVRHAHAAHVDIRVARERGEITVQIDDDGEGAEILPGHGLTGMRERLQAVSGTLTLSGLSPGVRLRAGVPL